MNIYIGYLSSIEGMRDHYMGYFDYDSMRDWNDPEFSEKVFIYYQHTPRLFSNDTTVEEEKYYLVCLGANIQDIVQDYLIGKTAESVTILIPYHYLNNTKIFEYFNMLLDEEMLKKNIELIPPRSMDEYYYVDRLRITEDQQGEIQIEFVDEHTQN